MSTPTAPARPTPLSPQTQQQQQSRLMRIVFLCLVLGPATPLLAGIVLACIQPTKYPKRLLWLLVAALIGAGVLWWRWPTVQVTALALWDAAQPLIALLRPQPGRALPPTDWRALGMALWPPLLRLWVDGAALIPFVALYLFSSRVKTAEELEAARHDRQRAAQRQRVTQATQQSKQVPLQHKADMVLGVPVGGDLAWGTDRYFTYPAALLGRHAALIGASGVGKTETCLRIADGAAQVYGWTVFYLDCKGDEANQQRFVTAMQQRGLGRVVAYPEQSYNGWRGDATAILNRLLAILDFTEPYYRDMAKLMISLAVEAPGGPPRSSDELLERLNLGTLLALYDGRPEAQELLGIQQKDAAGAYNRFRSFFRALGTSLDGDWAYEDVDAAYVRLDGLALKDQTASIGRFLVEDFSHYVSKRKQPDQRVLLIVDEFSAIAVGGTDAANLFERVRSYGAGIIVTSQSYAGMGQDADRILGAAATILLHQCPDPDDILRRAGMQTVFERRVGYAERGMGNAPRAYATGQGALGAKETLKVDPNTVKTLPIGGCVVIASGAAQQVQVSQLPATRGTTPPPAPSTASARPAPSAVGIHPVERPRWTPTMAPDADALPPDDDELLLGV